MLSILFSILLSASVAFSTLQFGISGTATAEATAIATYAWDPVADPAVSAFAKVKLDENPALTSPPIPLSTGLNAPSSGAVQIPFNRAGIFHLIALDGNENVIGTSDTFGVNPPGRLLADLPVGSTPSQSTAEVKPLSRASSPSMQSQSSKPRQGSAQPKTNTPAIVGSILGVVFAVLLGIVAFVFVRYRNRKRQQAIKEEMVARLPSYNFGTVISPAPTYQRPSSLEHEKVRGTMFEFPTLDYSSSLRLSPNTRNSIDQDVATTPVTDRQQEIEQRVSELEVMIMSLRSSGGDGSTNGDDLRIWKLVNQVESLKRLKYSPWALGETDNVPSELV